MLQNMNKMEESLSQVMMSQIICYVMMSQISKWSSLNKLTIHPTKTEAMILAKQQFIGPLQILHFGPGFVNLVKSTSCLGVTIDNKLPWHSQVDVVKASFSKKIGALRRMSYLLKLTLEEIYLKQLCLALLMEYQCGETVTNHYLIV